MWWEVWTRLEETLLAHASTVLAVLEERKLIGLNNIVGLSNLKAAAEQGPSPIAYLLIVAGFDTTAMVGSASNGYCQKGRADEQTCPSPVNRFPYSPWK